MPTAQTSSQNNQTQKASETTPARTPVSLKTIVFLLIAFILGAIIGSAYAGKTHEEEQEITVIGYGKIDAQTDQAIIYGSTETMGANENQAIINDRKEVEKIKAELLAIGLSPNTFQITDSNTWEDESYDQYPDYYRIPSGIPTPTPACLNCLKPGTAAGSRLTLAPINLTYTSSTNFTINLDGKKFNSLDTIINILEDFNTNPYVSYSISLSQERQYEAQVKELALQDARNQAEKLAKINKSSIKKLSSFREVKENEYEDIYEDVQQYKVQQYNDAYNEYMYDDLEEKTTKITKSYEVRYIVTPNIFTF